MWPEVNGGCPHHDRRRIHQCNCQLANIRHGQIEEMHLHTSFSEGTHEIVDHLLRAAMHGDIWKDNLVLDCIGCPVSIGLQNKGRLPVHGTMAGGNHPDV